MYHLAKMSIKRRNEMKKLHSSKWILMAVLFSFIVLLSPQTAQAADPYPTRPITVIVGYAPGGTADLTTRALADAASKMLNQPVTVVYKTGGATSVSLSLLKGEKPDGYTLGLMAVGGVRAPLMQKLSYDPVEDFTHIVQFGEFQFGVAVAASAPWKTMDQFVQYAKANPGKIRYAHPGIASGGHLGMEKLAIQLGIKWSNVPFEGDTQSITALMGGHVEAAAGAAGGWINYTDAGKIRLLSMFTEKRVPNFPEVPTLVELYKINIGGPLGISGPKGIPEAIVAKLHETFKKCIENQAFMQTTQKFGIAVVYRSPQEFKAYLKTMMVEDAEMLQKLNLRK
jgi:tripartite-type tricarboxylate transporter receptor subunit TctC